MRVLVLGATGRLGQMLQWGWQGERRIIPVWHGRHSAKSNEFNMFDMLLAPKDLVRSAQGVEVILCLAGITPASGGDMSRNTDLALAARCAAQGKPLLVASSAAVYGRATGMCRESEPAAPAAPYGVAKLAMERAVLDGDAGGVTCLRIGNVAGADQILGRLPARDPIQLDQFPDGRTPARSYIGPQTLADVLAALVLVAGAGRTLPPVLNIASPGAVQMGALLDAVPHPWQPRPAPEGAIAKVMLDTAALERFTALDAGAGRADALVAEWAAYHQRTDPGA